MIQLRAQLCLGVLGIWGLFASSGAAEQQVLSSESQGKLSNESLLWGPYKPNLYFGVRPRLPKSLTAGLIWAKVDSYQDVQNNFRHTCEQHEGMAGYGWDEYDIRHGGIQTIHDADNGLDLTTEFIKVPGGEHGGNWAVRVKGTPREDAPDRLFSTVMFYATMEGFGSLGVENEPNAQGIIGDVVMTGSSNELGDFKMTITDGPKTNQHPSSPHPALQSKPLDRNLVATLQVPDDAVWQAKGVVLSLIKGEIEGIVNKYGQDNIPPPFSAFTIPNHIEEGNAHVVQKVFEGAFEFDVIYTSGSSESSITSDNFDVSSKSIRENFADRFSKVLAPKAPFDGAEYRKFAYSMFSNLFGGIGYFYGDSIVDRSYAEEYDEENEGFWEETAAARLRQEGIKIEGPSELFTSIPSRPFFPRGFLWDEGFHLIPIAEWDMDVTLSIIKSWFQLIDEDGWIGREQILGPEARSKVPQEFTTQYPQFANPPTLFLTLELFIDKLNSKIATSETDALDSVRNAALADKDVATQYLKDLYPLLRRHYLWFRKTQRGDILSYDRTAFSSREAYRWRGRTERHILASGLDDYPRPQPPHPGELHVDLISWMGMMTRSLRKIAQTIGESEDESEYAGYENAILRNIDDLHWSSKHSTYCDATIDEYEESVHVCHKGYISIFPFLTGLLAPDSPRLKDVLDLIADPAELWSDYGLRSLSGRDEFYRTDENYWRSPVWMNMNYLAVQSLHAIATSPASKNPHKDLASRIYNDLRQNLVRNVYKEWKETGFAWEQYDPETGKGQRTQHFTGWTSLVVKIMSMPLVGAEGGEERKEKVEHGEL